MAKSPAKSTRPPLDEPYERFHWSTLRAEVVRRRLSHDFRRSSTKKALSATLRAGDSELGGNPGSNKAKAAVQAAPVLVTVPYTASAGAEAGSAAPVVVITGSSSAPAMAEGSSTGLAKAIATASGEDSFARQGKAASTTSGKDGDSSTGQAKAVTTASGKDDMPSSGQIAGSSSASAKDGASSKPTAPAADRGKETADGMTAAEKKVAKLSAAAKRALHVATIVTVGASGTQQAAATSPGASPRRVARLVRPRRGCRFRLINVLLSPEFNEQWKEMITLESSHGLVVNQFWLDVHVAFNSQNSVFDGLHFQDELFGTVSPNVVLSHSAARLFQMWIEIVGMYRSAVRGAQEAVDAGNTTQSFFDFCSGRLDLLYLHMALLLEPKLFEFIMSDAIPGSDQFPTKIKIIDRTAEQGASAPRNQSPAKKAAAKPKRATATGTDAAPRKRGRPRLIQPTVTRRQAFVMPNPGVITQGSTSFIRPTNLLPGPQMVNLPGAHPLAQSRPLAPAPATITPAAASLQPNMAGFPVQNPEYHQLAEKSPEKSNAAVATSNQPPDVNTNQAQEKTAAAPVAGTSSPIEAAAAPMVMVQPPTNKHGLQTRAPFIPKTPEQNTIPVQHQRSSANQEGSVPNQRKESIDDEGADSNCEGSGSSEDYDAGPQDARPRRRQSPAKRPREESEHSTAIVEVPDTANRGMSTSTDMVPHPHKRYHTSVSTAITPARPVTELALPPDEWDILEKRLRKVNENIDRCHCALTGVEANVSDSYRQTLEADLRFYSAIKQRLQEQLLVVMQSGY